MGGCPAGLEHPLGVRSLEGTELSPAVLIFQQHKACKEKLQGFRKNATVCYLLWGISTCPSAQHCIRALLRERVLLPGAPPAINLSLACPSWLEMRFILSLLTASPSPFRILGLEGSPGVPFPEHQLWARGVAWA